MHVGRRLERRSATASRMLSSSPPAGVTRTGTASTQPSAIRVAPPERLAAAFAMHVPSRPIVIDANPSAAFAAAGTETESSSSPSPTAVI